MRGIAKKSTPVAGVFLAKAKRAQPGLCMVDHMLARCTWAARLGADDIAEAHGVERALHGADVRLQAHHVYLAARRTGAGATHASQTQVQLLST